MNSGQLTFAVILPVGHIMLAMLGHGGVLMGGPLPPLRTASAVGRSYNVSLNGNHYHNYNQSQLI